MDERYLYQGWNLIAVYHPGETAPAETYTWGKDLNGSIQGAGGVGGLLLAKKRGHDHNAWIYHSDANGNVTEVTDSKGKLLDHYEYDPFGQLVTEPALPENRYRFSTKSHDAESGFYYYGFRYYVPVDGRWICEDHIGEEGGLNLYGIVDNDTVNKWDYLGLTELTFTYVTEIETPTITFPTNPPFLRRTFNGGVKTKHSVTVDADACIEVRSSKSVGQTIEYDSNGGVTGTGRASGNSITQSVYRPHGHEARGCWCRILMVGDESNPLAQGSPGITYRVMVKLIWRKRKYAWMALHDRFPSHKLSVGNKSLHVFSHVSAGTTPLSLFPPAISKKAKGNESY